MMKHSVHGCDYNLLRATLGIRTARHRVDWIAAYFVNLALGLQPLFNLRQGSFILLLVHFTSQLQQLSGNLFV